MSSPQTPPGPPGFLPDVGARYTQRHAARLFDLPESRLRYWSQTGFITPSIRHAGRGFYSFQDLISIKVAKGLLDAGLPLQRVRRSLDALRLRLPRVAHPLSSLRIRCDHDRVVVEGAGTAFDPSSGQLLLDFDVENLQQAAAEVLSLPWVDDDRTRGPEALDRTAHEWFMHGRDEELRWVHEQAPDALDEACEAYRRALELDPGLTAAATNLGALLAEAGDLDGARDAFDHALQRDPDQPEARSNLAELALRQGEAEVAIEGFRHVLRIEPDFLDAHYGLARALLEVGGRSQALAHLNRFVAAVERLPADERDEELEHRRASAAAVAERLRRELDGR